MSFQFYFNIIISFLYIAIACFVYFKNIKDKRNVFLALISFFIGCWLFSYSLFSITTTYFSTMFWGKVCFSSAFLISPAFYLFSVVFPKEHEYWNYKKQLTATIVISLFIVILFDCTRLLIKSYNQLALSMGERASAGNLFFLAGLGFIGFMVSGMIILNRKLKWAVGRERMQILYLNASIAAWASVFFVFTIILPVLGNISFVWLAPSVSFIFIFGILYSLFKYRLLDIEVAFKRTSLYMMLVGIVTSLYSILLLLIPRVLGKISGTQFVALIVMASIILAITIQPLRNWLDKVTDRFFFQKKYDYISLLSGISNDLSNIIKYDQAFAIIGKALLDNMHLRNIGFYLWEKPGAETYFCRLKAGDRSELYPDSVEEGNPVIEYLLETKTFLDAREFKHQYGHLYTDGHVIDKHKAVMQRILDESFQGGLLYPIRMKQTIVGFMVLGEKMSDDIFSYSDLAMLGTLSNQLSTALQNVSLFDQMLNSERLVLVGTMSAGIAHEIRNPLAAIKTFIQMLPDKYQHDDFRRRFNDIVPSELERITSITTDLLTFAKPAAPTLETVLIPQLLDRILAMLNSQLRKKSMSVRKELAGCPTFQADAQQLNQVFLNLLLNAVHASETEGKIIISYQVKESGPGDNIELGPYIYVEIQDTGCGIKKKDMSHIFEPFFTTKTEGTGLGLPTCKRIIEAHKGDILVSSEENKGTKFTVKLPMGLTEEALKRA